MADNLIQLEQDVETFIDPNGVPGSILAQNHQDILKSVLNKVGKYVGSPYLATKNETNLQPGLMSWRGNVMNNTNQFQIDFAKLTADLNDFGLILKTLAEGDLIHFKDSKGRSVFLEYIGHTFVDGSVPIYQIFVKGKAENINYVYQDNERLISVLQSYKQNSAGAIYEIQFNAPNFVLLENGVPKTSIDLSIAITDTIQASETSLADFATNSANYTFQQGDVISIVTNPDNILELYLYKSGTKTDVNNYQKIDASKIDWSNVLNKPNNITNIEIQNFNGISEFEVTDFIQLVGGVFDPANKRFSVSPLLANTIFIHTTLGDDNSAEIENKNKPFRTISQAISNIPTDGSLWTLQFLNQSGTINFDTQIPNIDIQIKSDFGVVFDFSSIVANITLQSSNKTFVFEAPKATFIYNKTDVKSHFAQGQNLAKFVLIAKKAILVYDGINSLWCPSLDTTIILDELEGLGGATWGNFSASTFLSTMYMRIGTMKALGNYTCNQSGLNDVVIEKMDANGFTLTPLSGREGSIVIREILDTGGTIRVTGLKEKPTIVELVDLLIPNSVNCQFAGSGTIVSGTMNPLSKAMGSTGRSLRLNGFSGKVEGIRFAIDAGLGSVYEIINSRVNVEQYLLDCVNRASRVGKIDVVNSTILSENPSFDVFINISGESVFDVNISGFFSTNSSSYGLNAIVNYLGNTFKEKLNELVIRSKKDIVNKTLQTGFSYIIDGTISLSAGEFIYLPPAGQNLTINGYGLELSQITKNVSGEAIFVKNPNETNAGGIQMFSLKLVTPQSQVFDLVNDGNDAIELNVVNFEGCQKIGTLENYRQFLGTTLGVYGCDDGFTLSGTWSGFKVTNTNAFGFGSTGILFRAGTGLSFSSRFFIELNVAFPSGSVLSDFANGNFVGDQLFQIKDGQYTLNGSSDDAINTPLLLPNITEKDSKTLWEQNVGISSSFKDFARLKGEDGLYYELYIDNTGTINKRQI